MWSRSQWIQKNGEEMQEPLFAKPRRKQGAAEALAVKTLKAWHQAGYLAGDDWALARGALRDAARAVDQAREQMYDGEGSPYSFARANALMVEIMQGFRQGEEVASYDGIDELIANISSPTLGD